LGRLWTDDERLWQMLESFPFGRQKIPKMIKVAEIVGKLKIFFCVH